MLMKNETYCKGCGNSQQPVHFLPCSTCKAGTTNMPSADHSLRNVTASTSIKYNNSSSIANSTLPLASSIAIQAQL